MIRVFDPQQSRTVQLNTLSSLTRGAKTAKERAIYLRQAKECFTLILKRHHNNFTFLGWALAKPLEHIEVICSMANNWQKEFASVPLTETHKEPLRSYAEDLEHNPLAALENLLGSGFKVSVVWSNSSSSFIVSVIGTDENKHNSKKVLSSFSDDLGEAFFMAAYKVFVVVPDQEWPTTEETSRWG